MKKWRRKKEGKKKSKKKNQKRKGKKKQALRRPRCPQQWELNEERQTNFTTVPVAKLRESQFPFESPSALFITVSVTALPPAQFSPMYPTGFTGCCKQLSHILSHKVLLETAAPSISRVGHPSPFVFSFPKHPFGRQDSFPSTCEGLGKQAKCGRAGNRARALCLLAHNALTVAY